MCSECKDKKNIDDDINLKLDNIFSNINDWLRFAEQKNAALLLLNGGIVWGVTRLLKDANDLQHAAYWLNLAGYAFTVISALICILSFLPILQQKWFKPEEKSNLDNCLFFAHIAKYDANGYLKFLVKKLGYEAKKTSFTNYEVDLSKQIVTNSEIALDKYKRFKLSATCTTLAVFSFLIAIGITIFTE